MKSMEKRTLSDVPKTGESHPIMRLKLSGMAEKLVVKAIVEQSKNATIFLIQFYSW